MKTAIEIQNNLPMFTGTEHYYRHPFGIIYTDGVLYLADSCECYWLLDIVASYQTDAIVKQEEFQVYKLKVNPDKSAIVEISDGNYKVVATQDILYTDFPLPEIVLWFANGVCYLPSEH